MLKETVNIRVYKDSRDRLKVTAAKRKKTIMAVIDDCSKGKI